jgi:hypothetical protein
MWKLFDPRSTAARTSGTLRDVLRDGCGAERAETAGRTRIRQAAVNEEPQPQVVTAFGLRITN